MICPKIIIRPLIFFLILNFSGLVTFRLCLTEKQNAEAANSVSDTVLNKTVSEILTTSKLLPQLNSSAIAFARSLSSLLNGTQLSFSVIQTKVAPRLFLAFSTIPYLSQVSYMGNDGLFFSYYLDKGQNLAVFSNASFSSYRYVMPVNRDTGMLYGDAVVSQSLVSVNTSWVKEALHRTNGYSTLTSGWNVDQDRVFLSVAAVDGRGVISLGYPSKLVIDHFSALDFHRADFHLTTPDNEVIVQSGLQDTTQMVIRNGTLMVNTNGDNRVGTASCFDLNWKFRFLRWKIKGVEYFLYCSEVEIAGVQLVYVLAYPMNGFLSLVQHNSTDSLFLLAVQFLFVVICIAAFIFLIMRAAKREMLLCASLVNQTHATQQAERKSMNKTNVIAQTNHDVRHRLAEIIGLVELFYENEDSLHTEIKSHLGKMKGCTKDMLEILNSVLDMSKIEAGKMELKEEVFNLAQLLEDVVDRYYTVGKKKGLDVLLDPCDGSILRVLPVKGDMGKLKQILCNLLGNAIKFTSEGHVSVRATVKTQNIEKDIIESNRNNSMLKWLSELICKNKKDLKDLDALHREQNPNCMEFEFEVDDTGMGIPKDKQASVFEDFVQVKGAARELEGCGLGLGIVQSMVRIMGGEIKIVEKMAGEKGTCFRFNVQLTVCEPADAADDQEETSRIMYNDRSHPLFPWKKLSPRSDGSHVILFIAGEERRRVLRRCIENLNVRVTPIKQMKNLCFELEKLRRKLNCGNCLYHSAKLEMTHTSKSYPGSVEAPSVEASSVEASLAKRESKTEEFTVQLRQCDSRTFSTGGFTLVVIDGNAGGNYYDLCLTMANFRREVPDFVCQFVWLDNQMDCGGSSRDPKCPRKTSPFDHIIKNPLHGSRFIQVIQLLPECRGMSGHSFNSLTDSTVMGPAGSRCSNNGLKEVEISKSDEKGKEELGLKDKKILVVDDGELLRKLAVKNMQKLGAQVEECENGKEAVDRVCEMLRKKKEEGDSEGRLPYDYIIMDCEMPVMDGYEATREIRKEEKKYGGVHTPIIAVTAHAMTEEASKTMHAGMDAHLTKPLQMPDLLDLIRSLKN